MSDFVCECEGGDAWGHSLAVVEQGDDASVETLLHLLTIFLI